MPQEPINLQSLLMRRKTSYQQWLKLEGITTKEDFIVRKKQLTSNDAFFIPLEMEVACLSILPDVPRLFVKELPLEHIPVDGPAPTENIKKSRSKKTGLQRNSNDVVLTTEAKVTDSQDEETVKSEGTSEFIENHQSDVTEKIENG